MTILCAQPFVLAAAKRLRGASRSARLLFLVQIAPALAAIVLTAGLIIPAFLKFEPAATVERIGPVLVVLSSGGAFMLGWGGFRAVWRTQAANRLQREWLSRADPISVGADLGTFRLNVPGAVVATIGLFRPRIFVSAEVLEKLTQEELAAAIAHEVAHVRAFDNCKRLLLRTISWASDAAEAWRCASECAADEHAVRCGAKAVELASALVKVSRMKAAAIPAATPVVSLASGPIAMRVNRLLQTPACASSTRNSRWLLLGFCCAALLIALVFSRPGVLATAHDLIERVVR
jgi:Zn-dependent protease with chaperone function